MAEEDRFSDQNIYAVVNEIIENFLPLDQYSRLRVYRTVGTFFGFEDPYSKIDRNMDDISREPKFSSSEDLTPKEFLLSKQPNTIVERVACLAYYLARNRNIKQFKTIDVSKMNTEAAQTKLSNPSYAVRDAVRSGYLAAAEEGMKQLSAQGEQYVEALPDRDAAKKIKLRTSQQPRKRNKPNRLKVDRD